MGRPSDARISRTRFHRPFPNAAGFATIRHMTDPITVAVLQNRLNAIAEEMGEAMLRTSYSQILNSSRDFSVALIDARCRLVAQPDHIPVHVGAMPWAAKALVEVFPNP